VYIHVLCVISAKIRMEKLRIVENILDLHYEQFEIMSYPKEFIIRSAIKCFEDFELALSVSGDNYFDSSSQLTDSINALDRCVRWASKSTTKSSMIEVKLTPEKCEQITCEYFAWGYHYSILESFHISYSKGLSKVSINETSKTIRFEQLPKASLHLALGQAIVSQEESQDVINNIPDHELVNLTEFSQEIIDKYILHFQSLIFPELDHNFEFDGYTKSDFIKFWTILYLQFRRYVFTKRKKGFSDSYSSDVSDFVELYSTLLDAEITESILSDLTFSHKDKAYLWHRPFVKCDFKLLFSPSLLTSLNPNDMLIGALNKSSKKHIYDNAMNTIEAYWTDRIMSILTSNNCFEVLYKKNFTTQTNKKTPDFVIINKNAKEFIIIDYKHFSKTIKTYEVFDKQKKVEKATKQIMGYVEFFKTNKISTISDNIDIKEFDIIPVLLLKNPIPLISINAKMNYLNYWVLKKHVMNFKSFKEILKMERPENKNSELNLDNFETTINQIEMKDWTYEYESMSIPK